MFASRLAAFVIVLAAALWVGSGVFGRAEQTPAGASVEAEPVETPRFKVAVVDARPEMHERAIVLSGRTEADDRASAVARAAGTIVELGVRRGSTVEKGDVIASLSDEAREAQVAQAQALVEQRRVSLDAKMKLIKRGITPANEKNQLEADLAAAEAALAQAQAELERGQVIAPISGVVSDVPVTTGQAVQPSTVVAEIVALDPMLAVVEVAERQLAGIDVGDEATVRLVTGETARGEVRFISPTASATTRTYRVDVELDNPKGSIPDGITADVELKLAPVEAVRVARSALTFSAEGRLSVRTVGAGDVVASVPVTLVEDAQDEVWLAGPDSGDRIIVQGQDFVKDGQVVEPVAVAEPALISRN